jgi:hypothetical protein
MYVHGLSHYQRPHQSGTLVTTDEPTRTHTIKVHNLFTLGFTLADAHFKDLEKCMIGIHNYSNVHNHLTALDISKKGQNTTKDLVLLIFFNQSDSLTGYQNTDGCWSSDIKGLPIKVNVLTQSWPQSASYWWYSPSLGKSVLPWVTYSQRQNNKFSNLTGKSPMNS